MCLWIRYNPCLVKCNLVGVIAGSSSDAAGELAVSPQVLRKYRSGGTSRESSSGWFRESSKKDCIRSPGHLHFVRVYKIINDMQRTQVCRALSHVTLHGGVQSLLQHLS